MGVLNVVEAPDILYNETSNDTIVAEGASVSLRCEARGFPEPTVLWRREHRREIVLRTERGVKRGKTSHHQRHPFEGGADAILYAGDSCLIQPVSTCFWQTIFVLLFAGQKFNSHIAKSQPFGQNFRAPVVRFIQNFD